jgi:antitoxin VapB
MALNIKSDEADRLARALAAVTGESITAAVTAALRERLERVRARPSSARDMELDEIFERAARIPPRDARSDEEILGYDDLGAFG